MEKNLKKNTYVSIYIYIYISESLCCTPETNTTLQSNYTSIKKKQIKKDKYQNTIYIMKSFL